MAEVAIRQHAVAGATRDTMRILTRAGAATGLASMVVTTVGYMIHGDYPLDKSGAEIVKWAAASTGSSFTTGLYVEIFGFLLFLVFATWLWMAIRDGDDISRWLSTAGFAGAMILLGMLALDDGVWMALLNGARHGTAPETLFTVRDAAQRALEISYVFEGLFLLCIGYVLFRTRSFVRWLGVGAILLGIGCLVPPIALLVGLAADLWFVVLSIYLLVRPAALDGANRDALMAR